MKTRFFVWGMMVLALVLASCGGGETSVDNENTAEEAETTAEEAETTAEEAENTADSDRVEEFYTGNTITLIVASSPGGGFDTYGRLIAKYMENYIPGNPTIVVENMPGAGHMLAANHLYSAAPRDGTVFGTAIGGLAFEQLFGNEGVEFDMREFRYIGMPDPLGTRVLIVTDEWEGEFEDVVDPDGPELILAGQQSGDVGHDSAVLVEQLLAENARVVEGYDGSSEIRLSMEQGETHGYFNSWHIAEALDRDKFQSGQYRVIAKYAEADEGEPELEDVPSVYDFAESEEEEQLLRTGGGYPRSYIRIYFTPPDVPDHLYAALNEAFHQALEDPDLLEEAEAADLPIDPLTGEQVREAIVEDTLGLPEDLTENLQQVLHGE